MKKINEEMDELQRMKLIKVQQKGALKRKNENSARQKQNDPSSLKQQQQQEEGDEGKEERAKEMLFLVLGRRWFSRRTTEKTVGR